MNEHKCKLTYNAQSLTGSRAWRVTCPTCDVITGAAFPEMGWSRLSAAYRIAADHLWRWEWIPRMKTRTAFGDTLW